MRCLNCGEEIPSGKKFCGFCGAKIQEPDVAQKEIAQEPVNPEPSVLETGLPETVVHEPMTPELIPPPKKTPKSTMKWLFVAVPILLIVAGLILAILLNWIPRQVIWGLIPKAVTPEDKVSVDEGLSIMVAGDWVGEIGGDEWSATIEIEIDEYCEIGSICGTYRLLDSDSHGELELVEVLGFGYRFLEHPIGEENVPGPGYQTMSMSTLEDKKLNWSFRQELPSGDILISSGILDHQ